MCLYPKLIKNKKYTITKKNNGKIPDCDDERKKWVAVGCGNCIECRNKKKREWQVRMQEEIQKDKSGKFVTLTFSEEWIEKLTFELENINYNQDSRARKDVEANDIATLATRRFLERWRKEFGKSIKHWLVTELGHENTERLHLHGIIFTNEGSEKIKEKWMYGEIWVGQYVNERTINYIIKYVSKVDEKHIGYKSKVFTSPGIGKGFMDKWDAKQKKYKPGKTDESYRLKNGAKTSLPIYYRNKIYNEEERENLWVEKLDKEIRFVMGQKIDVSTENGEKEYEAALKYNQEKYKAWGYGDGNWEKKSYLASKKMIKNLVNKKEGFIFAEHNNNKD